MAEPPVILPPNIDEVPPPGLALVEELDKLLMVQMRDGRKIIGILRSFDQFANLVLEGERRRRCHMSFTQQREAAAAAAAAALNAAL